VLRGHTGAAWWLSQSSLLEKRRNEKKKVNYEGGEE